MGLFNNLFGKHQSKLKKEGHVLSSVEKIASSVFKAFSEDAEDGVVELLNDKDYSTEEIEDLSKVLKVIALQKVEAGKKQDAIVMTNILMILTEYAVSDHDNKYDLELLKDNVKSVMDVLEL